MKNSDIEALQKEFENFSYCTEGSCETDESDFKDYPDYTGALYALLMAPYTSGIYISKWDIKEIAQEAGESMAIHPRKRMFELLMKYATSKETMQSVLDAMEAHIEGKIAAYEEFAQSFPSSTELFVPKIEKAYKTIGLFPRIIEEYFE